MEKFGVLVWKYTREDHEYTEQYDDVDDIRADYNFMTQLDQDYYEYVVMQEVTIDDYGREDIVVVDEWHRDDNWCEEE